MNHLTSFDKFLSESKINESTDLIGSSNGNLIIVSDYVKNHIKEHNELGTGSIFKKGITELIDLYSKLDGVGPLVAHPPLAKRGV